MVNSENTKALIKKHCDDFPKLEVKDILKFLHQSSFGCEHLVSSLEKATEFIKEEYAQSYHGASQKIISLDGDYSRVSLSYLDEGLSPDTLAKLFVLSSKEEKECVESLEEKLEITKELAQNGFLPFSKEEFESAVLDWKSKGYVAVHHSDTFRREYHPSYRVIANKYIPFLPLFSQIDKKLCEGKLTLAIEGGSASGKSTLGKLLEDIYGCTVFHMDDFFLRPEQRTPERFKEIGGNVDYERFLSEVISPLCKGEEVVFSKFDCSTMSLCEKQTILPEKFTVVEGAYSMHPKFGKYENFSVFLDIGEELQKQRILHRNSPYLAKRFFEEWIPLEKEYFDKTDIKNRCDLIIEI